MLSLLSSRNLQKAASVGLRSFVGLCQELCCWGAQTHLQHIIFVALPIFTAWLFLKHLFLFPTRFNVLSQTTFYSLVGNLSLPAGFLHCMLDFTIYMNFHDCEQMMFVCPAQERISWRPLDTWIDQREWPISLHNFLQAMHICVDMLSLTHPNIISQQCSETFDNILNLANWPKEILSIRRRHQSQLEAESGWVFFLQDGFPCKELDHFPLNQMFGEARLSFGYFHHLVCCTQCLLRMISYGFLKMLPANPHGSCGFTVEVGSMAPLVKVGEGLKVGVATQLLPGLGCFCTSLWTSVTQTHNLVVDRLPKKRTVPINLKNNEPFFCLLLITATKITT